MNALPVLGSALTTVASTKLVVPVSHDSFRKPHLVNSVKLLQTRLIGEPPLKRKANYEGLTMQPLAQDSLASSPLHRPETMLAFVRRDKTFGVCYVANEEAFAMAFTERANVSGHNYGGI
ncbi:hypothetical protein MRX96_027153 [Rhipicephalus microplus]